MNNIKSSAHIPPTLVIFCKKPKMNQGKQRLAYSIGAEKACQIAEQLLACAIEDAAAWQGSVVIACAHKSDLLWAQSLLPDATVIPQYSSSTLLNCHQTEPDNLGHRLNYVDCQLRLLGHKQLVFIGTDAPLLNSTHYQTVLSSLKEHDIVLSNASDGGVTIMANSVPWPSLTTLPWSTHNLSEQLAKLCQKNKQSVFYIASSYDIDFIDDLEKLSIDLVNDNRPARQALLSLIQQLDLFSGNNKHA